MFEVWWNMINFDTLYILSREDIETWCHRELDLLLSLSVWTGTNKQREFCFHWNLRLILLCYLKRNQSLRATNCLSHYMAVLEADMSTDDINLLAQYAFSLLKLIVRIDSVCPFLVVVFTYRIAHFPMSSNKIILLWYVLVFLINTVTYIWHFYALCSLPVTFLDHVFLLLYKL